ncbi:MAG: protoporphyrinogen oxidase [Magnetococcales bacterium]|nr:protoporphyrinogen oxidase [Magnetococcales bacterium]MBF0418588.1 protoporphyrinogen oxidase [Magnetococcales bacterium]MBF0436028.1 protoporphyrinogen oxidase [Magnetococcales bacterium]
MTGTRAIIIGGGISGLSLAFFLKQRGIRVTLLERTDRTGGVIRTSHPQGFLVEHGPNSTLQKPGDATDALGRLMDGLGLHPQIAAKSATRRYVQKSGRLQPLPLSPLAFLQTPLFSATAKLRVLLEPFRSRATQEESVSQFVRRRLGPEFLDWAIDPFISGVYAGDPERLSVRAAIPKIYALEHQYGSLIRGAIALRKQGRINGMPKGRLISFAGGMEDLVKALRNHCSQPASDQVEIMTGVSVETIEPLHAGGWCVTGKGGVQKSGDWLILAIAADEAAHLVRPLSTGSADTLASIRHAPVVSMALGFARKQVNHPLDGFGFLIPAKEKSELLGCLFSSSIFPGRAGEDHVILTTFLGGTRHPTVVARREDELIAIAMERLEHTLDVPSPPPFVHITRYQQAIAQYELGHLEKLEHLQKSLASQPGLHLCGNFIGGVSVADRVRYSEQLANHLAHSQTFGGVH